MFSVIFEVISTIAKTTLWDVTIHAIKDRSHLVSSFYKDCLYHGIVKLIFCKCSFCVKDLSQIQNSHWKCLLSPIGIGVCDVKELESWELERVDVGWLFCSCLLICCWKLISVVNTRHFSTFFTLTTSWILP